MKKIYMLGLWLFMSGAQLFAISPPETDRAIENLLNEWIAEVQQIQREYAGYKADIMSNISQIDRQLHTDISIEKKVELFFSASDKLCKPFCKSCF